MSVIVVVKKNKKIAIAADSNYSVGSLNIKSGYLKDRSKIIQHGDTFFGLVGATAHEHVIADLLKRYKSKLSFNSEHEIFRSYLAMHDILTQEYYLRTDDEESTQEYESSQIDGLIANPKGIFGIYTWREVYEYEKFWAIGSGRNFALGSLFSTFDELSDAQLIAEKAVQAACEFDDGCELPIKVHTLFSKE
jgi:ATP-dependent protease HslVU (ClpYQ) peptidase subunit